ncbi:hypothetical protein [Allokutzneria albata]|uniref:hypothetical protein n=1 Tax=Allokutzneria albata TaxID=211114 RepID=UPI0009F450D0|nr:hypothetical protein [Allokutzneria albata]
MRQKLRRPGIGLAILGLVITVAGTFLPWLYSGSVQRNSYEAADLLRRLLGLDSGVGGALLVAWPAIGPVAGLCVAGYVLGLPRAAAVANLLLSAITGAVGVFASVHADSGGSLVGISGTGPVTVLVGAVLALLGAIAVLASAPGPFAQGSEFEQHRGQPAS